MAEVARAGWELNSTAIMEFSSATGTIQTGTVRSGTYAGQANATATTKVFRLNMFASNQTTIGYNACYFNFSAFPSSGTMFVLDFLDIANANMCYLRVSSAGLVRLINSSGTVVGAAGPTLSLNTWYLLELKNDATTNPGTIEGRVDGTVFATGANDIQGSWGRARAGILSSATANVFMDDWVINDNSGSFSNSYPGPHNLIILRPTAAGDSNGFATQVGGTAGSTNNFTRVNEVTPDDATTYNASVTLSAEDLFNITDTGLNTYDVISSVSVGVRAANLVLADATTAFKVELEKTSGGTKTQSGALIPNTTNWRTNAQATEIQIYPIVAYQDPDGAYWTQSTLDASQIGYTLSAANVQAIAISNIWAYVNYTPGTPPKGSTMLTMGVG